MILTEADRRSLKQTIRDDMGPALLALLADPDVIDIHANPDGRVWIDTLQGRKRTDLALESSHIELIIRHVAAYHGRVCNEEHPDLMAVFPLGGERFQGERLPISAPSFTIRKHLQQVLSLSDLIEQGALTVQHAERSRDGMMPAVARSDRSRRRSRRRRRGCRPRCGTRGRPNGRAG